MAIFPCAVQHFLVACLFYTQLFVAASHSSPVLSPLYLCICLFCYVHIYFLDFTCKW